MHGTNAQQSKSPAPGPAVPSAERGKDIALRFCSSCHFAPGATTSVPTGVPSLRAIANKSGQTAKQIEFSLINPHPPMPDAQLTRLEIVDIIEYLDGLRQDRSAPPFNPPADKKPTSPKQF